MTHSAWSGHIWRYIDECEGICIHRFLSNLRYINASKYLQNWIPILRFQFFMNFIIAYLQNEIFSLSVLCDMDYSCRDCRLSIKGPFQSWSTVSSLIIIMFVCKILLANIFVWQNNHQIVDLYACWHQISKHSGLCNIMIIIINMP